MTHFHHELFKPLYIHSLPVLKFSNPINDPNSLLWYLLHRSYQSNIPQINHLLDQCGVLNPLQLNYKNTCTGYVSNSYIPFPYIFITSFTRPLGGYLSHFSFIYRFQNPFQINIVTSDFSVLGFYIFSFSSVSLFHSAVCNGALFVGHIPKPLK